MSRARSGYCDVCNRKVDFYSLVRTQVRYGRAASENLLACSSYDSDHWDTDLSEEGLIGFGSNYDQARTKVNSDNSTELFIGTQVLAGEGYVETVAGIDITSMSAGDELMFSVDVGPYHLSDNPWMTGKVQLGDDGGANAVDGPEITFGGIIRLKVKTTKSALDTAGVTLSDVHARIVITGDDPYFWFDRAQVNTSNFNQFLRTTGTAEEITSDETSIAMVKVCPRCYETIHRDSQRFNTEAEKAPEVVPAVDQQF